MHFRCYTGTFPFLLLMICFLHSPAQNRYLDSLQQLLKNKKLADTSRMEIMIAIGDALQPDHSDLAKEKYLEVYKEAQGLKNPSYMASAMSGIGKMHRHRHSDSAMYYYLLADSLYQLDPSQNAKESRATVKASIAELLESQSHFEEALKIYLETIEIMENSDAKNKWMVLGVLYANVGGVYHDLHQFSKVLEYDLKALEAYKKRNSDPLYVATFELYVSGDYKDMGQLEQAKIHIENAEKIARELNSADLFYRIYNAWGGFYQKSTEYEKAIDAYQKAMNYAKSEENLFRQMNCNRMLGFIYRDMKEYRKSIPYIQEALAQTRKLKNKLLEVELLKSIAMAQSKLNNKEAVGYYEAYIQLSDSLNKDATQQKINEIENKYQSQKKQDSILTLQKNTLLQSVQLKQKDTVNIALIAGCISLFLLAVLSYKNFKNRNRLFLQSEKIRAQQLSEWEKEKKLLGAQSLMKGQEEERSRLARDLHDGVGGLLSGVKLSMSTMKGNVFLSEESARSFENVIGQLDQSIAELRRVSHNMMPEALIKYGLKEALENYCENLNLSGQLNVQLQSYGMEKRMEQSTEIVVYRIVQELLANVIKHAEAKKVLIQLVREDGRFNLTVEDDGKGFDVNEIKSGAGLANIRARIDYLNGSMDIVSKSGEGTSVHIEGNGA